MAKEVLSVRISAAAKSRLDEMARERGVKPADVLERLILGGGDISSTSAKVAAARLKAVSTGGIDPEKIAAFQRKAGMTAFEKRRR